MKTEKDAPSLYPSPKGEGNIENDLRNWNEGEIFCDGGA